MDLIKLTARLKIRAPVLLALAQLSIACSPFTPINLPSPKKAGSTTSLLPPGSPVPLATPTPTPTPAPAPTPSGNSYTLKELAPFNTRLTSVVTETLPPGAIWDAQTNTVYWIPQKGQTGTFTISANNGTGTNTITLTVEPAANLLQGPSTLYRDGDVGFVFVHGLSSENYCLNQSALTSYWGITPEVLSPRLDLRRISCYDGTRAVEESATIVAQQILDASCGSYNRCIVVAHSMGNLIMEYILTHDRQAQSSDPEPQLFDNATMFAQVKSKLLFVVSMASAAGGSKVATILNDPNNATLLQGVARELAGLLGQNSPATRSLTVQRASTVLAPFDADPGIPFFMVAGYTTQTVNDLGLAGTILGNIPQTVYNGDNRYAKLDPVIRFSSRSDGMVDFRSACGIASEAIDDGPGYQANLTFHFDYCARSRRKPNHFLWFVSNLNHSVITAPFMGCYNASNPCISWFPDATGLSLQYDGIYYAKSAVEVIRAKLIQ
jgi:hypothetical protein